MRRRWFLLSACLALTCARPGSTELAHAEPGPLPRACVQGKGPLSSFFGALTQLERGARSQHVRVLWLGDSHTNADYLSGTVRGALAARFGDGGPGYLRVGSRPYRHDGVKLGREGKWNVDPDPPARRSLQGDGVFGFAGTRAEPGPGASFSAEVTGPGAADSASFELSYSLPEGASFELSLDGKSLVVDAKSSSDVSASGIAHFAPTAPIGSRLVLTPRSGTPRLFGAIIERQGKPGLVLDTAGIDGARLETPLAWNEAAFVAEVSRRSPELFVLAYGTNEAFDALKVEKYGPQLAALVGRVRQAAPHASCLVLGPTDAPQGEGSVPRVAEVGEALRKASGPLGCSYVSLQQLMGGEGSFARGMKAKERTCQSDKLHLTPKGYQELGRALAKLLLDAYSAGCADVAAPAPAPAVHVP